MIDWQGHRYCNATEGATYLEISRSVFYLNVRPFVAVYRVGAYKRLMYRVEDLHDFLTVRTTQPSLSLVG